MSVEELVLADARDPYQDNVRTRTSDVANDVGLLVIRKETVALADDLQRRVVAAQASYRDVQDLLLRSEQIDAIAGDCGAPNEFIHQQNGVSNRGRGVTEKPRTVVDAHAISHEQIALPVDPLESWRRPCPHEQRYVYASDPNDPALSDRLLHPVNGLADGYRVELQPQEIKPVSLRVGKDLHIGNLVRFGRTVIGRRYLLV